MLSPEARRPATTPDAAEPAEAARERRRLELRRLKSGRGPERRAAQPSAHDRTTSEQVEKLRRSYLQENPKDAEGAEIFAGLLAFLDQEHRLNDKDNRDQREKMRLLRQMTEFNARWTQYVHARSGNRDFLARYWSRLESIADRAGGDSKKVYFISRSGILTQTATLKIFEALGLEHHLAKPEEDAYEDIDMWMEDDTPIQIKTEVSGDAVGVIETDTAAPLHIEIGGADNAASVSAANDQDVLKFRMKLNRYAKHIGRQNLKGLFLILPKSKIDRVTGEPAAELVEEVRAKLAELGYG